MTHRSNSIVARYHNAHGHLALERVALGATFDDANDIDINANGLVSFRFEGWNPRGANAASLNDYYKGQIQTGLLTDAITLWERHFNPNEPTSPDFEEYGMLHGA